MSKKKRKDQVVTRRPKGTARTELVLRIVETDSTFDFHPAGPIRTASGDKVPGGVWIGKCIHCGRKLGVSEGGETDATVEHINPLCAGGDSYDPRNLALACAGCNNEKGIRHDQHVGKGGRADEVITALQGKRLARWREPTSR